MIWLYLALLTGAAAMSVLWPLRRASDVPVQAGDADFYRRQLADIADEEKRGLLGGDDLASARIDAARRLLAASQVAASQASAPAPTGNAARRRSIAALVGIAAIPAVTLPLYVAIGAPGLPDQPALARLAAAPAELNMEQALAKIEAHLLQSPDDGQGFDIVAPIYLRMGRTDDALRAYSNAIRLLGATPERLDSYGEAMIAGAGDVVTAQAKEQFAAALKLAPADPKAQFFLGIAAEQEGDRQGARAIFEKLVATSAPDAPWVRRVKARIAALDGKPAALNGKPAALDSKPAGLPAPSGEAAQQVASLPAGQQQVAIRGMVDGLAARLAQDGQDLAGWLRLVRAYAVLNEPDKARAALGEARRTFASDTDALRSLEGLGRDLGLGG